MSKSNLDERVAALTTMSSAQLRGQWLQLFRSGAPTVSRTLLALAISYRLQEKAVGGLPASAKRELARLGAQYVRTGELATDPAGSLKVGTRLVRNWGGAAHHVTVRDTGFDYNQKTYRSLSHIARDITGANWSGPRFFGLRIHRRPARRVEAANA